MIPPDKAKDVNTDLSKTEGTPQLRRYLESLGNLVLTDYLEFRWYVGGEHRLTARAASVSQNGKLRVSESANWPSAWQHWLGSLVR